MEVNELYKQDYNNLQPDEKAAWQLEDYQLKRAAIEDKVLPEYSRELNELESLLADLFDRVLKPLPKTNID